MHAAHLERLSNAAVGDGGGIGDDACGLEGPGTPLWVRLSARRVAAPHDLP